MASKKATNAERIGAEFIAGMKQLIETAKEGGHELVKKRHGLPGPFDAPFKLPTISAQDVTEARTLLGVDQPMFARILGVSVLFVRSWEEGTKPPTGAARRLIGEIRATPDHWRTRFGLKAA